MSETTYYGTPGMLSMMREAFGAPVTLQRGGLSEAVMPGFLAAGAIGDALWKGLTRRNEQTGAGEAVVSRLYDRMQMKVVNTVARIMKGGSL